MSGHSKWATIRRQKGVNDAKRGAIFTKLGRAITVAVREGGGVGDPAGNFKLRLAVDRARQFNMPKENIARAIDRAVGGGGDSLTEVVFEGFLPGGVVVLVSALTDSKLRTAQQVRGVLDRGGGSLGGSGSVSYLFSQTGEVRVKYAGAEKKPSDAQELELIDLGAQDIEEDGEGGWYVYCEKERTFEIRHVLEEAGYTIQSAELVMKPNAGVNVELFDVRARVEAALEKLEDLDDVVKVWTNYA